MKTDHECKARLGYNIDLIPEEENDNEFFFLKKKKGKDEKKMWMGLG